MPRRERNFLVVALLAFLALIVIPYYFASISAADGRVFGGFLQNPIDGNSYLAKMRQGYEGSWLFTLPYTADPGLGAPINLYYLFLGRLARVFGFSLIFVFHFARVAGALLLGLALYRFFRTLFPENWQAPFILALLGSGLGWLAIPFGLFTSDFWVAEAYPFLASYTNAHFPLGLALQVWLLTPLVSKQSLSWKQLALMIAAAAVLSTVFGFGWVIVFAVLSAWLIWLAWKRKPSRNELRRWFCVGVGGGLIALHQWWIVHNHPVLAQWNAQNLTPAPSILDLAISLSPALFLAVWGAALALRSSDRNMGLLAIWIIVGIVVIYFPFNLQRRLISGLYIPVAGLAAYAIQNARSLKIRQATMLAGTVVILSMPTNLLVLAGGFQAAQTQPSAIYLQQTELQVFEWLNENSTGAIVMAAPDSGLLIPAYSDARVIYGHPFETVDAEEQRHLVEEFYSAHLDGEEATNVLANADVDYVLYGPREMVLGALSDLQAWQVVFEADNVQIWAPIP